MFGSFVDDVEFVGILVVGLEDVGFDLNIVVNDLIYCCCDLLFGFDELYESGFYKKGFFDMVEDFSKVGEFMMFGFGFVIGEIEIFKDEGIDEWVEVFVKLIKKEKWK